MQQFVTLLDFPTHEISTQQPWTIRRIADKAINKIYREKSGYQQVSINGKTMGLHRLVAIQFIPTDDKNMQVDHKNQNRSDNSIINLRWFSRRDNCLNRTKPKRQHKTYNYLDILPTDYIELSQYGRHQFEGLYFSPSEDMFYMSNGINYKELHVNEKMNGALFVYSPDVNGKGHQIHYIRAKKIMEQNDLHQS
ncbi:MAG: hypothetical protein EZS28_024516 [Streblomastix strix]|uniref:HNH nuclease domain-containing protein n=1 Tax=Streblomastix strix TaxID=222440 RepID=A0A5J4VBY5_9EUKA|nr:MAG: hypothetical protein EZS28_024516 [Streblomastix strix]